MQKKRIFYIYSNFILELQQREREDIYLLFLCALSFALYNIKKKNFLFVLQLNFACEKSLEKKRVRLIVS